MLVFSPGSAAPPDPGVVACESILCTRSIFAIYSSSSPSASPSPCLCLSSLLTPTNEPPEAVHLLLLDDCILQRAHLIDVLRKQGLRFVHLGLEGPLALLDRMPMPMGGLVAGRMGVVGGLMAK